MGGQHPIRIQSMTNTLTSDVKATVDQIARISAGGADYARVTVPARKDADCLEAIKAELVKLNCNIPLVADIHFNPTLANISAAIVEKVRVNPGNYIDKKLRDADSYSDEEYNKELNRLREKFVELLKICRQYGTALRIGTNHGSLSDRIMSRYGDTAEGMAESAMEFLRICHQEKFDHVVVSMKSSNTRVMVYATRLLLTKMEEEGMEYPLHLGVTEAGEGEDGRIRSAVGIGTLLADGIGETIRVSLTEDPEDELPVCKKIVSLIKEREGHETIPPFGSIPIDPYSYNRRLTLKVGSIGGEQLPVVVGRVPDRKTLSGAGWIQDEPGKWTSTDMAGDLLVPDDNNILFNPHNKEEYFLISWEDLDKREQKGMLAVQILAKDLDAEKIAMLKNRSDIVLILESKNANRFADFRAAIFRLLNQGCKLPVILRAVYAEKERELFQLRTSLDFGGLFIDGLPDGIWLENTVSNISVKDALETAFGILQASRVRVSKTEYISCPSCGRTLFDLQTTTRKIRERTSHLKGLKIGIMGCIVNGPGEMADANYGYVGAGKGKVTLYKEKEVVRKNIPEKEAVNQLIELIKENGDWLDP